MSELQELEGRIAAALDRMGRGIEALSVPAEAPEPEAASEPGIDPEVVDRLREALEAEKIANAQLEERVRTLHARQDEQSAEMSARLAAAEAEAEQLRALCEQLGAANQALRAANAEGVGDADAINAALQAELDSLRALRDSDRAELDGVIADLAPMIEEQANA